VTLAEKQQLFTRLLVELIQYAWSAGYEVVLGETYRPPETAKLYAAQGRGSARSVHCDKLAADVLLFKAGEYLRESEQYTQLGRYWQQLHPWCRWGGNARRPDGNHFSLLHEGRY
jgi:hypothetical protein